MESKKVDIVETKKMNALDVIVKHYGGPLMAYDEKRGNGLAVIKVAIDSMKGKESKP